MIGRLLLVGALAASNVASHSNPSCTSNIARSVDVTLPGCRAVAQGGPIPVYVYPTPWEYDMQVSNPYVLHMTNWLSKAIGREDVSAKRVIEPSAACLFLVTAPAAVLCNSSRMDCGFYEYWQAYPFETLSHWGHGAHGGMNHLLYMPWHTDWELPSYPMGRALLMRSAATNRSFWRGVDVQVPFYTPTCDASDAQYTQTCSPDQQVVGRGAAFLPDWVAKAAAAEAAASSDNRDAAENSDAGLGTSRVLLAGFVGAIRVAAPFVVPAPDSTVGNRVRVSLACLHLNPAPSSPATAPYGTVVVADPKDEFDLEADITRANVKPSSLKYLEPDQGAGGSGQVWGNYYWRVLLQAKYALCPGGAGAHSQRLNEAIAAGAVPVVFDDDVSVLPLASFPEADVLWQKCAIHVQDVDHVATLTRRLEQHFAGEIPTEGDAVEAGGGVVGWWWKKRQLACAELHNRFFASHDDVIDSAIRQIAQGLRNHQVEDSESCQWQRPLASELVGFNGAWPGEDTPFAARERVAAMPYARALHPPAFAEKSLSSVFEEGVSVRVPHVGTYQEGLMCMRQQLTEPLQNLVQVPGKDLGEQGHSDDVVNPENIPLAMALWKQQRLVAVASALGEESVVLQQYDRAADDFSSCRRAFENMVNISRSHVEQREGWAFATAAWCDYVSGLLAERRAEESDARLDHEAAKEGRSKADNFYARALNTCPERAREWSALRDGPIVHVVQSRQVEWNHRTVIGTGEASTDSSNYDGMHRDIAESPVTKVARTAPASKPPSTEKPVVCASVDPISWLAWEFPMSVTRDCPQSKCRVNVDQGHGATPINGNNPSMLGSSCNATVYLTSFGGRPNAVNLPKMPRRNHVNAVVFMENDVRIIQGGRQGLALAIEKSFGRDLSLALGYRPTPPWDLEKSPAAESNIQQVPWRRVSYLNDPLERFRAWPNHSEHAKHLDPKHSRAGTFQQRTGMIPGIAFFSSQCDSVLAKSRLDLVAALVPALEAEGVHFASFGKCFHTADLAEVLPECAQLPRHTVDHDEAKSCALSRFAFTLAVENSEDDGYATEKLWQPLLAGSVPIYWGAPDVKAVLPDPSAAVHVRDFTGDMLKLGAYLRRLLESPEAYELHRAWKRQAPQTWSRGFRDLASIPKDSTFCTVCDYAANHALEEYSEAFLNGTLETGDDYGGDIGSNDKEHKAKHVAAPNQSPLGFFDLNVEVGGKAEHYRVDIPRISNDAALQRYVSHVCAEVKADASGCLVIGAEVTRLQVKLSEAN